jgi:hypothetical protein
MVERTGRRRFLTAVGPFRALPGRVGAVAPFCVGGEKKRSGLRKQASEAVQIRERRTSERRVSPQGAPAAVPCRERLGGICGVCSPTPTRPLRPGRPSVSARPRVARAPAGRVAVGHQPVHESRRHCAALLAFRAGRRSGPTGRAIVHEHRGRSDARPRRAYASRVGREPRSRRFELLSGPVDTGVMPWLGAPFRRLEVRLTPPGEMPR